MSTLEKYEARLERTQMEVGTGRGYRWTEGYFIIKPTGEKLYPPMLLTEARAYCKREGWTISQAKSTP